MKQISKQKRKELLRQQMKLLERGVKMSSTDELPAYVDAFIELNRELPGTNPFLYELMEALLRAVKLYINEDTEVVMDTDTILNLTYAMMKLHRELSRIRPRIFSSYYVLVNLCSCFHKKIAKFLRGF